MCVSLWPPGLMGRSRALSPSLVPHHLFQKASRSTSATHTSLSSALLRRSEPEVGRLEASWNQPEPRMATLQPQQNFVATTFGGICGLQSRPVDLLST
jgi:hypothetical protein